MKDLRRELNSTDIHRYVTYYAPRTRSFAFNISEGMRTLSIQALHNLQLLTRCQSGAFSPKLRNFIWGSVDRLVALVGSDYAQQFFPGLISLFMGRQVEKFSGVLQPEDPISLKVAVHSGLQICEASLREVWIVGGEFAARCLESFSWETLDTLTVHYLNIALLPLLTSPPRLRNLEMAFSVVSGAPSPHIPTTRPAKSLETFKSLQSLKISMPKGELSVRQIFPYIPRTKALRSLQWHFGLAHVAATACQDFVKALEEHADRMDLVRMEIHSNLWQGSQSEALDMDHERIDFSPLQVFRNLEILSIGLPYTLHVTPAVIADIPICWPRLRHLHLCPFLSTSCPPSINHTHILDLSQRLPGLEALGIQFDATWVTGQEGVVGQPSQLRRLHVGRSPICSPSAVLSLLRSNFPKLKSLRIHYTARPKDDGLFKERWQAVAEGLEEVQTLP